MQNPFLRSAEPKFASRRQILDLARTTAERIAADHPQVTRILLFGSFARGDFGTRSDMDLLILLKDSSLPIRDRIAQFLEYCSGYPADVFPLTETELEGRLRENDPFWVRAVSEAIECYRRDEGTVPSAPIL